MKFPSTTYLEAKTYLEDQVICYADKQPDCNEIHLPCCLNKQIVYDEYKEAFEAKGMPVLSLSRFRQLWAEHFDHVKVRKVSQNTSLKYLWLD